MRKTKRELTLFSLQKQRLRGILMKVLDTEKIYTINISVLFEVLRDHLIRLSGAKALEVQGFTIWGILVKAK